MGTVISAGMATMNTVRSMFAGAALLALPAEAQEHRFEDDPVVMVRENFVACDVLSQLQRVMDNPRFLLSGECDPVRAGDRVRVYARRGPYVCIYPHDTSRPVNRRTRKRWPNKRAQQRLDEIGDRRWRPRPGLPHRHRIRKLFSFSSASFNLVELLRKKCVHRT